MAADSVVKMDVDTKPAEAVTAVSSQEDVDKLALAGL